MGILASIKATNGVAGQRSMVDSMRLYRIFVGRAGTNLHVILVMCGRSP